MWKVSAGSRGHVRRPAICHEYSFKLSASLDCCGLMVDHGSFQGPARTPFGRAPFEPPGSREGAAGKEVPLEDGEKVPLQSTVAVHETVILLTPPLYPY